MPNVDVTDLGVDLRFDLHMHGINGNVFGRVYGTRCGPTSPPILRRFHSQWQ